MSDEQDEHIREVVRQVINEQDATRRAKALAKDDNGAILELIKERMIVGEARYGHGIRVHDDTRQWGTSNDSWVDMGLEEILDLCLYLAAQIMRLADDER